MKNARQQYEYYKKKLIKEAQREGLTSQEEKLYKIVSSEPENEREISKRVSKIKAEFKRIRKTKKYKEERRLRNQFYKLVGKYEKEELEREARRRLNNLPPAEDQLRGAFFKNLTYKKLMEEGITRHIDNKVIRYKGFEAVKTQIKSLAEASDSEKKKQKYIQIYIENLIENGIPTNYNGRNLVKEMEEYLQSLSPRLITYALDTGHIQSIQYYYIITETDIEAFARKIDYWTSPEADQKLKEYFKITEGKVSAMSKLIKKERELKSLQAIGQRPKKNY